MFPQKQLPVGMLGALVGWLVGCMYICMWAGGEPGFDLVSQMFDKDKDKDKDTGLGGFSSRCFDCEEGEEGFYVLTRATYTDDGERRTEYFFALPLWPQTLDMIYTTQYQEP